MKWKLLNDLAYVRSMRKSFRGSAWGDTKEKGKQFLFNWWQRNISAERKEITIAQNCFDCNKLMHLKYMMTILDCLSKYHVGILLHLDRIKYTSLENQISLCIYAPLWRQNYLKSFSLWRWLLPPYFWIWFSDLDRPYVCTI